MQKSYINYISQKPKRLAILTSHPIQYQAPLFREYSKRKEVDVMVFFCLNFGSELYLDEEFGQNVRWDTPILSGYKYKFLKNYSPKPTYSTWWGEINLGIVNEIIFGRYDSILIFGWSHSTHLLAFLAAFISRTPVLLHGENPLSQEMGKNKLKLFIKKIIFIPLFWLVSSFLYIGEQNKMFYKSYGVSDKKLFFTPYAVENKRFLADAEKIRNKKSIFKKKLGIPKEEVVILFAGKLIAKKCPMDLLHAFELLSAIYNLQDVHLLFVGDGELRSELEKYVAQNQIHNAKFFGFKNQTELSEYYGASDIFVLPSGIGETWGLAVNEAMCFGLPIIISDVVGCSSDLVKNGENGFIFKFGDTKHLASCINTLVVDRKSCERFGKKSFEIIKDFSYEKDVKGILEAISM